MTQVKMPDPVAYRYRVIDDEWEYSEQSFFADGGSPGDQEESDSLITTTQAEAYAAAKVREALEEYERTLRNGLRGLIEFDRQSVDVAITDTSRAIRALIPPNTRPGQP